jgi:porphobilinogen deaminase
VVRAEQSGARDQARALGKAVAEELLARGADQILREAAGHGASLSAPGGE